MQTVISTKQARRVSPPGKPFFATLLWKQVLLKLKRPSNAEISEADKDQEQEVNQRLELADENDLYFDASGNWNRRVRSQWMVMKIEGAM